MALAVGEDMAPSGLWSLTERKGVTRTQIGGEGREARVFISGVLRDWGGWLLEIPGREEAGPA